MQWRWRQGVAMAPRVLGIAIAAMTAAGCVTTQPVVSPEHAHGATIAFESLDGAPRETTARLLSTLNEEAKAQQLVVVPRSGQASYRLRGYVATDTESRAIVWAWDVYGSNRRRVSRVTGSEPGLSFDTALLTRVARASIEQVTAAIAADRAPAAAASASAESPPAPAQAETQPGAIPLPPWPPGRGATPTSMAFAVPGP